MAEDYGELHKEIVRRLLAEWDAQQQAADAAAAPAGDPEPIRWVREAPPQEWDGDPALGALFGVPPRQEKTVDEVRGAGPPSPKPGPLMFMVRSAQAITLTQMRQLEAEILARLTAILTATPPPPGGFARCPSCGEAHPDAAFVTQALARIGQEMGVEVTPATPVESQLHTKIPPAPEHGGRWN